MFVLGGVLYTCFTEACIFSYQYMLLPMLQILADPRTRCGWDPPLELEVSRCDFGSQARCWFHAWQRLEIPQENAGDLCRIVPEFA